MRSMTKMGSNSQKLEEEGIIIILSLKVTEYMSVSSFLIVTG